MSLKRKRVDSSEGEQRALKRPKKISLQTDLALEKYPDDCLLEILNHLPRISLCTASMVCKRFNDVVEALLLKELSKKLGIISRQFNMAQSTKKSLKEIFYPRAQYLAFEQAIRLATKSDDINLEKLLNWLHDRIVLKISERRNNRRLKTKLPKLWERIVGRFGYKEISSVNTFVLWGDSDGRTVGERFHVSFSLFGQKEHFVEVRCNVFLYNENMGGYNACKLELNAKLHNYSSTERVTEVKGLLEGYMESRVNNEYKKGDEYREWEDETGFIRDYLAGDRVRRKWLHICYPKLNKEKLNQVNEWLGWNMSPLELGEVLAELSMDPSVKYNEDEEDDDDDSDVPSENDDPSSEAKSLSLDTSDTKAALEELLLILVSNEEDLDSLTRIEQTLSMLTAKVSLKNRIRNAWKEKDDDDAKASQLLALIDRSKFTKWSRKEGEFESYREDPDLEPPLIYRKIKGEIQLVGKDSQWVRYKFKMFWIENHEDPDSDFNQVISTASGKQKESGYWRESWRLPESHAKLLQTDLGLENFSMEEIIEFVRLISGAPRNEGEDAENDSDEDGDDDE